MKFFEYLQLTQKKDAITKDEAGNVYVSKSKLLNKTGYRELGCFRWFEERWDAFDTDEDGFLFLTKEEYESWNQYEIIFHWDETEARNYYFSRRPYYRMRGKSVTEEQAFDIIRRTDSFFYGILHIENHRDFVMNSMFDNWLISKNHYPYGYGWIHADGTVGANAITQKYPSIYDFIGDWLNNIQAFPYLDLVIAVTEWDEVPDFYWDLDSDSRKDFETEEYDDLFYKAVVCGIYVHEKKVEILDAKKAVQMYKTYNEMYGKDREMYLPEYYDEKGIVQVDTPYLKRCIEAYGLDADEELKQVPEYIWLGDTIWSNKKKVKQEKD